MTTRSAVIFDLGGVLIDWNPRYLYRKIFADETGIDRFLSETGLLAWNEQMDAGRPFAEAVEELSAEFPHYAEPIAAFHQRWIEMVGGAIEPTVAVLRKLKDLRYPVHALSNWSAETFPLAQERFDFLHWFDDAVISGRHGIIKPDPRIFELLLSRTGLRAKECIYIDDSEKNVRQASIMGFRAVHFTGDLNLHASLKELGVKL